jgi:bisphosphoglycerate-dependent phosphoglycerate mutase
MDNTILYTAKFTHHDLKCHKVWWKSDKRFGSWSGQTDGRTARWTDGQIDRQADSYTLPPQTTFAGGIKSKRIVVSEL